MDMLRPQGLPEYGAQRLFDVPAVVVAGDDDATLGVVILLRRSCRSTNPAVTSSSRNPATCARQSSAESSGASLGQKAGQGNGAGELPERIPENGRCFVQNLVTSQ